MCEHKLETMLSEYNQRESSNLINPNESLIN